MKGVNLISGKMKFPSMDSSLSEKDFAIAKVSMWFGMLKDGKSPTKWFKPTSNGTSVNFDFIKTEKEFQDGLSSLKGFITEVNSKYDTDLYIK